MRTRCPLGLYITALRIIRLCGVDTFEPYHVLRLTVTFSFLLRINRLCGMGHFDPYHALRLNVTAYFYVSVRCYPIPFSATYSVLACSVIRLSWHTSPTVISTRRYSIFKERKCIRLNCGGSVQITSHYLVGNFFGKN